MNTPFCLGTASKAASAAGFEAEEEEAEETSLSLISKVSSKRKASCSEKFSGLARVADGLVLLLKALEGQESRCQNILGSVF